MPAQPQADSLARRLWGAESVPRKKQGSPETAARRRASRTATAALPETTTRTTQRCVRDAQFASPLAGSRTEGGNPTQLQACVSRCCRRFSAPGRARTAAMFDFGFQELILIFVVALVVLGPKRMQQLATTVGRWVGKARGMARQFRERGEPRGSRQGREDRRALHAAAARRARWLAGAGRDRTDAGKQQLSLRRHLPLRRAAGKHAGACGEQAIHAAVPGGCQGGGCVWPPAAAGGAA